MPPVTARRPLTASDLLAIPEGERFHEIIDGELVRKATPSYAHGDAQSGVAGTLKGPFQRPPGGGGPGGWWIATEVEIELTPEQIVRPDVAGWRRERVTARPTGSPIREPPDWICEILWPSNADEDTVRKFRIYQRASVAHYWIIDPIAGTSTVHRWSTEGYLVALVARRGETVRAEPFDALEVAIGSLLGDDPEP